MTILKQFHKSLKTVIEQKRPTLKYYNFGLLHKTSNMKMGLWAWEIVRDMFFSLLFDNLTLTNEYLKKAD